MIELRIKQRRCNQPAPPWFVFEALTQPNRDPAREWLHLRHGEIWPEVLESERPGLVVWSSLWSARPDVVIRFDLSVSGSNDTYLRWTMLVEEPAPDDELTELMRYRLSQLINANLRYTFGQ